MPTFHVTLLGNVFLPGRVISANLRIVGRDLAEAEATAEEIAEVIAAYNRSGLTVDSVYELSNTIKPTAD